MTTEKLPPILDACCGSRMFHHDKHNPLVLYNDKYPRHDILCDGRTLDVTPDTTHDFTDFPYNDESFEVLDWYNTDQLIAAVKAGITCLPEDTDTDTCEACPAKQYCDTYKNRRARETQCRHGTSSSTRSPRHFPARQSMELRKRRYALFQMLTLRTRTRRPRSPIRLLSQLR